MCATVYCVTVYGFAPVSVPVPIVVPTTAALAFPSPKLSAVCPISAERHAVVTVNSTSSGAVWGFGTVQAIEP